MAEDPLLKTPSLRGSSGAADDVGAAPSRADDGAGSTLAPVLLVVLLLVLATAYSGAFSVRAWAPPALLVLGTLLAMQLAGGVLRLDSWPLRVMVGAIWGLAAWAALSMLWSPSPSAAWEGAGRTAFYAALVSVPPLMLIGSRALRAAGLAAVGGIAALALIMAVRLVLEGENVMLAGRLNEPVGYRNATACLFALGVWPLLSVAATRGLSRFARAMAFALAELCLGLAYLTQSRGIVLGLAAGGLVAIGLGPDRVRRAWLALALVAGLALASNWLLTPYDAFIAGTVGPDDVDTAATALVVLTLAAFAVGLAAALFDSGLRAGSSSALQLRRLARVGLVVVAIGAVGGGLAAAGNPIAYASDRWDEFRGNETTLTGSRLGNVSGQRYDLWRVALREFKDAPLIGVGEGGYPVGYYELRETDRNLSNPHSLLFGTLAELGIVDYGVNAVMQRAGAAVTLADLVTAATNIIVTGDLTASGGGGAVYLGATADGVCAAGVLLCHWLSGCNWMPSCKAMTPGQSLSSAINVRTSSHTAAAVNTSARTIRAMNISRFDARRARGRCLQRRVMAVAVTPYAGAGAYSRTPTQRARLAARTGRPTAETRARDTAV